MRRLVCSVLAVAYAVSFNGCEGHSAAALPEHYQHKMDHDGHKAHPDHPASTHPGDTKDPNLEHREAVPAPPEAKPGANPEKKH